MCFRFDILIYVEEKNCDLHFSWFEKLYESAALYTTAVYLQKKRNIEPYQILMVLTKKFRSTRWTPRYAEHRKLKRQINWRENYSINTRVNLKTRLVWEKKKKTIINEMLWCNVLWRTVFNFSPTDNFAGTFAHFCFMIFTLERINTYVDPCPKNLQLYGVSQVPLSMYHVIFEKKLRTKLILSNFLNSAFKIIKLTDGNCSHPSVFFFKVGSKQKNKYVEYHKNEIPWHLHTI